MRIVIASDDTDDSDGAVGRVRVSAPAGLLGRLVAQLRRLIAGRAVPDVAGLASTCRGGGLELTSQLADLQRRYAEMIRSTQAHIAAGRCYQLNCTVPVTARLRRSGLLSRRVSADDIRLWLAMLPDQAMQSGQQSRKLGHTGGYAAVLRWPGRSVVSLSPECLVQADHGRIWTMPIKGSRPPSQGAELTEAEKDAAELAMIVDLARNDLGRLAHVGSVQVDGPETLVLDYIHHREATVSARLRTGQTWRDIFCALFPAGSITGAPKAAAMRHLRDLEQRLRGAYCGSIGWLAQGIHGPIGACSVAIRTAEVHADQVRWQAGGGIVSDSDPDAEWHEVEVKSTPFFRLVDGGSVAKPD
jgi:anthranilate/para-aminobenzoate synthase component I